MRSALVLFLVLIATPASGYPVGPAIPLEKLAQQVDLVCKATVISARTVVDPTFDKLPTYEVRETELRVVSAFKGKPGKTIKFRHYARANIGMVAGYAPLLYTLVPGRTYLIFAKAGRGGTFRQFQRDHTQKEHQGVLLAADDKPHQGSKITDVAWTELRGLLASAKPDDVLHAIEELDLMSGGRWSKLADFQRGAVLAELKPLILASDDRVATAAITVFGSDGPYFIDRDAPYWLAGIGKGRIPGLTGRTPSKLPGAVTATRELMEVANTRPALKPLAIRALGRTRTVPAATLARWAKDRDPEVRRAAILVSAETANRSLITTGTADPVPGVRAGAALAIGFSQDPKLLRLLDRLLKDRDAKVREAAAMSVLSFAVDDAAPVLRANLATDYKPLFVNALARKDPAPYLAQLGEVIEKQLQPAQWWGGRIPAADSWRLVFDYLKQRPVPEVASGKHDRTLDSLEKMRWFSSSEPTALYALYVHAGMAARARQFRDVLKKTTSFSMDVYLDRADKDPGAYLH